MRKRLLLGLAGCLFLSILVLLTRNTRPSLFVQGLIQSVYESPKVLFYTLIATASEDKELERLKKENRALRSQLVEFHALQKDNEALRAQFEEGTNASDSILIAEVIGFQGGLANPDVLILNKGLTSAVKKGQAVVIDKALIGVIDTVGEKYSSVRVITHPDFKSVAKTDPDGVLGVIQGTGDRLLLDRVAITDELQVGQVVVTRGTNELPPNIIIGKIETVRKEDSEPFQSAQVTAFVDTAHLTRVFILQ